MDEEVREAAKALVRQRVWASRRGKATRAFIRAHPKLIDEFEQGNVFLPSSLPRYVTFSSVLTVLKRRVKEKEIRRAVRLYKYEHPEEVEQLKATLLESEDDSSSC